MSEPNGPVCPECGTPRASDGTPACTCARRASDTRRDARAAERAAAEDFDPVRIRPFVELGDGAEASPDGAQMPQEPRELADGDAVPLPSSQPAPDEAPLLATDHLPERGRRTLLITGAGLALATVLTAAFLGGLFTYDSPSRGGTASDDIRPPVPNGSAETPERQPSGTAASASPSRSESPSPSATADDTSTAPSASPSATPATPPSSGGATTSAAPAPTEAEGQPPVLRLGDQGPEVVELQLRLRQIGLYADDADGTYDRQVESAVSTYQFTRVILSDESGVYGRTTRTSLESETSEP